MWTKNTGDKKCQKRNLVGGLFIDSDEAYLNFIGALTDYRNEKISRKEIESLGANYLSILQMLSCGEDTYRWTEQFVRDLIGD